MNKRIGSKMSAVVAYVSAHPGCSKLEAARNAVQDNPANRNMGVIYGPVDRAIASDLIEAVRIGNRYYLFPQDYMTVADCELAWERECNFARMSEVLGCFESA